AAGGDVAVNRAPEIDFVTGFDGQLDVSYAVVGAGGVEIGSVVGVALAADGGGGADGGKAARVADADLVARGGEVGVGLRESLVCGFDLWLEIVQFGVVEDSPPGTAGNGVGGFGLFPCGVAGVDVFLERVGSGFFVGRRSGDVGDDILGPNAATVDEQRRTYEHELNEAMVHWAEAPCLTTRTSWPSAMESAGSRMIWSLGLRPVPTWSVAPLSLAMVMGCRCTRPLLTTATRRPSERKSKAFAGTESCACCCGSLKCTKT